MNTDNSKGGGKMVKEGKEEQEKEKQMREISSSSSSIGINSDDGKPGEEEDENEAQTTNKSGFDTMAASLESTLPHNKSISAFYDGRLKSYANLSDACRSESAEDLAKAVDPYSRKRLLTRMSAGHKSFKTSSGAGIRIGGDMPSSETVTNTNQQTTLSISTCASNPKGDSENLTSSASTPPRRGPLQPPVSSSFSHESASSPRRSSTSSASAAVHSDGNRRPDRTSTDLQSAAASADDDSDNE